MLSTIYSKIYAHYGSYLQTSNKRHKIPKLKCFSSRLAVVFDQSTEDRCQAENEDVVVSATSVTSILMPTMVRLILDVWWYFVLLPVDFNPYPSGLLLLWHWGNHMIVPVPVKEPWKNMGKFHPWIYDNTTTINKPQQNSFSYQIGGLVQDVIPLLTHWNYIFLALTHLYGIC